MSDLSVVRQEKNKNFEAEVMIHRLKIFGTIFFLIAIIAAACFYAYHIFDTKVYTGYQILEKSLRSDSDTAKYLAYNGHVLKYSRDGAESYDGVKDTKWNVTYELQDPMVSVCSDYVALSDRGSNKILLMSGEGRSSFVNTRLPIQDFSVAGQGVVAAVLTDGASSRINIYSPEGEELAGIRSSMGKSGYPADIALSPDGTLLGVSYARVESATGDVHSSVAFYNFGDVGQNEIDNYVSGYDYEGTFIPRVHFLSRDAAVAIGDDRMIFFSGAQKPEAVSENAITEEIQSVSFGDEEVGLVFRSEEGGFRYRLKVYDKTGKEILNKDFDMAYTDVVLSDKRAVIYNDSACEIIDYKGNLRYDGHFEDPVLLMVPTSHRSRFILVNRSLTEEIILE